MKNSIPTLHFLAILVMSSFAAADDHMDELMSEGVDYDSSTVETVTTNSINMPLANKPKSDLKRPVRTDSKKKVISEFGPPLKQHPSKGKPPIERWDYSNFSVYFESNYVIHSVVRNNKN